MSDRWKRGCVRARWGVALAGWLAGLSPFWGMAQQPSVPADGTVARPSTEQVLRGEAAGVYRLDNLVAWCIVPFDSQRRTPAQRAEMLQQLGIRRLAYDYRAEHVPTFADEIAQLRLRDIELFAWWFPPVLNDEARSILDLLRQHDVHPQLWVLGGDPAGTTQEERIATEVARLRPICEAAQTIGCKVGLYNHGGWFGDPENQLAIIRSLDLPNVGIVYNLHHGHAQLDQLAERLPKLLPHLLCLNLNGMATDGEARGLKILPIGAGDRDQDWFRWIRDSGYTGPIGILNHTDEDAGLRLQDNLDGLAWLIEQDARATPLPPPQFRSWKAPVAPAEHDGGSVTPRRTPDDRLVEQLLEAARQTGDGGRGLSLFTSATTACHSCHRVGTVGGTVGPELATSIRRRTPEQLVAALLWPDLEVEACYRATQIVTTDGRVLRGYLLDQASDAVLLRDPALGSEQRIARDAIDSIHTGGSLMPVGLLTALSHGQQADLLRWLLDLQALPEDRLGAATTAAEHAAMLKPAEFPLDRPPLDPSRHPHWQAAVNRSRIYDFYAKQADYFRTQQPRPSVLAEFPGLDGPEHGHWGNQDETAWRSGRWQRADLGNLQSGVLFLPEAIVPRAICLRLGEQGEYAIAFDPDRLDFVAAWRGDFVQLSDVRHGFLDGLRPAGPRLDVPPAKPIDGSDRTYLGCFRHGSRVAFAYRIDGVEYLDAAWTTDGQLERIRAIRAEHPWRWITEPGRPQWPEIIETAIIDGADHDEPYVIDTIELPRQNPWKAAMYCGDHAFASDGTAYLGTMTGDVWSVRDFHLAPAEGTQDPAEGTRPSRARWRRFASGLHHVLGLVVHDDQVYALGRDQITRLRDRNGDGEADFYECFSHAYQTSPAGHDFICGLQRDSAGRFYTASGNQGLVQIAADGRAARVLATGFRNPDGLGLMSDGTVTLPCSEGEWTPASMICAVRPSHASDAAAPAEYPTEPAPFFGYGGPSPTRTVSLPMVYLPRGIDNSSAASLEIDSSRWGPLAGQWLHLSFGTGTHHLLLRDEVDGLLQGAIVPLAGEFSSGAHRGRFHPIDGQLYVSGMAGWGTYTPEEGCFQRVRYTGRPMQMPIGFRAHENGVAIRFLQTIVDPVAVEPQSHFVQAWNYRYGAGYGSAEYSSRHPGVRGHDVLEISRAAVLDDGLTLFLELPDLQPVNQLHLRLRLDGGKPHDLYATVHRLAEPRVDAPGYRPRTAPIAEHPIESDLRIALHRVPNPWREPIPGAREVRIEAGRNLSFETREFSVQAGEPIALTFVNPDVVPHNWALAQPGTLETVGDLANRLIGEPDAAARHYIPDSEAVLQYVDLVEPGSEQTIYFHAPQAPGSYPYLCTFPGHWMVMNGQMLVQSTGALAE